MQILKNTQVLQVNKKYKQDFTNAQKAAVKEHKEKGGVVLFRDNCGNDEKEFIFVEVDRKKIEAAKAVQSTELAKPAPAPVEPKPWREWNYTTHDWQYN